MRYELFIGSAGQPFPGVEVCITKPAYVSGQGSDVLTVTNDDGTFIPAGCDLVIYLKICHGK